MYKEYHFEADEILQYLRKSRSDDPYLTVEEVLTRHETILNEWSCRNLSSPIPPENTYREIVSGEKIDDRPQMLALLKRIENPRIRAILIVEVQRLSRGDLEDAGKLIKLLRYTNTLVITPNKIYDLQDEYDRDAFERELKRGNEYLEYTKKILKRGREQAVKEGCFLGNIPPYGYRKGIITEGKKKYHTLFIIEEEAEAVRMVFDLYVNQHMGRTAIAKHLNALGIKPRNRELWSIYSIADILSNDHYTGKVRWNHRKAVSVVENGEIKICRPHAKEEDILLVPGRHEAIISDELFEAAKARIGRNHRAKPNTKVRNPLAGLLFCQCGRAMSLRTYHKNGITRSNPRLLCDNQAYCHTSSALYEEVIELVKKSLREAIQDFQMKLDTNTNMIDTRQTEVKHLERTLSNLKQKQLNQWEKYAEESMPKEIFDVLNEKVLNEIERTQKRLFDIRNSIPDIRHYRERLISFQEALNALERDDVSAADKNELLKSCINRIHYYRENTIRLTKKNTVDKSQLKCGGNWKSSPIQLDVVLKL